MVPAVNSNGQTLSNSLRMREIKSRTLQLFFFALLLYLLL